MAQILLDEGAAASTPSSGKVAIYAKTSGLLFSKDDAGNERPLSGNGVATLADAATISCDISEADVFDVTIAGNRTINFAGGSTATDGKKVLLRIKQDGTGGRTITWGTGARFGTDITAITLSAAAAKTDVIGIVYNHAATSFDVVAFARGY